MRPTLRRHVKRRMKLLWMSLGVFAGFLVPWQTLANNHLRLSTGSPYAASLISYSVGTFALTIACLLSGRLENSLLAFEAPWWMWLGGICGVVALTGNVLLFSRLGAVETVVLPVAGQILMGLLIDQFGWFHAPTDPLTLVRMIGACVVMAGVMVIVGRPRGEVHQGLWGWRIAGVGFGALLAVQTAVNGQLAKIVGSPMVAAQVSFAVGAAVLLVANCALRWRPRIVRIGGQRNPFWMWCGGLFGACYVLSNAAVAPIIGTGLTVVAVLTGMMTGSLAVDVALGKRVRPTRLLGVAMLLTGVTIMRLL